MSPVFPGSRSSSGRSVASDAPRLSDHVVHIRRLAPFEAGLMRDHLLRLDTSSRNLRFGHGVSDGFIERYVDNAFAQHALVKACFVDGVCRGVGEAFFESTGRCDVEAAFSIESHWQGYGLGTMIFERLLRSIRNRGGRRICVVCLSSNVAMKRLAEKLDADLRVLPDGVTGEILRPPGGLLSASVEWLEDSQLMRIALPDVSGDEQADS